MRSIGRQSDDLQRNRRLAVFLRALAPIAVMTGMLAGCAAPTSFMGIDISNPAPAYTLSPEQLAFFQEQNLLLAQAQAAGCIPTGPEGKVAEGPVGEGAREIGKGQPVACHEIAEQLAILETRRPALAFKRSYADMPLTALASEAKRGSKQAQLELGIRFEEGKGVERALNKARKLYAMAASDSGGTIWVYSPAVGNGTKGRTIPVNTGPKRSGLVEAKLRLEGLE
ncbi:SEL1-like repeat protein [Parasphingorhabdus sp.]|uniref:SEL1-like repeat protein n=1 Tax=Parasphingorhabdus sp. TaxID=2709688 RepID=UPI002B271973|nr:SEL1-like repeat protein [Parasphingorhabdus sp.]